eukprot:scaffold938_cov334-Pavlova_lutheri.AAC.69
MTESQQLLVTRCGGNEVRTAIAFRIAETHLTGYEHELPLLSSAFGRGPVLRVELVSVASQRRVLLWAGALLHRRFAPGRVATAAPSLSTGHLRVSGPFQSLSCTIGRRTELFHAPENACCAP